MMAKDPAERYQNPMELAEALTPWVQTPIDPPPEQEMPQLSAAAQAVGGGAHHVYDCSTDAGSPRPGAGSDVKRNSPGSGSGGKKTSVPTNGGADRRSSEAIPIYSLGPNSSASDSEQTRRRNAPAPIVEHLPTSEPAVWESLATDTSDNAPDNTDRQTNPSTRPQEPQRRRGTFEEPMELPLLPPERPERKPRNMPALALLIGSVVLFVVGAGIVVYWYVNRTPVKPPDTGGVVVDAEGRLTVSRAGGKGQFKTVKEALEKVKEGQRIVILDSPWEESLTIATGEGKGVTIEGGKDNKEVVWKLPAQMETSGKIILLQNPEGLTLRNLTFDGKSKTAIGIQVRGKAGGLRIEDVFIKDMKKAGIVFENCEGTESNRVVVRRTRVLGSQSREKETDYGILFQASSSGGVRPTLSRNEWITVSDCRIEGPYMFGAFTFEGSASKIDIRSNRIYHSTDGISIQNSSEQGHSYRIQITNNTFCNIKYGNGAAIFIKYGGVLAQRRTRETKASNWCRIISPIATCS